MSYVKYDGKLSFGDLVLLFLVAVACIASAGNCARVTIDCARRGGTTVRNVWDWPVCVNGRAPSPTQESRK